jgi:hypothetical protein
LGARLGVVGRKKGAASGFLGGWSGLERGGVCTCVFV